MPDPSIVTWQEIATGLNRPVDLAVPGNEQDLLFVVEQTGSIRIIENGLILDQPFLDLSSRITTSGKEQGLLGLV